MIDTKVIRDEKEFICCYYCDGVDAIEVSPGEWEDCPECGGSGGEWKYVEDEDEG